MLKSSYTVQICQVFIESDEQTRFAVICHTLVLRFRFAQVSIFTSYDVNLHSFQLHASTRQLVSTALASEYIALALTTSVLARNEQVRQFLESLVTVVQVWFVEEDPHA